jgi:DNA-directed RNA polymerase subunit RPC12/RpoP
MREPELTLLVDKPDEFSVTNSTVGDTITITVKDKSLDLVEDARVTIWLKGEVYEYKTTNSNGKVSFSVATNTDEMASLTVVKDGFVPFISQIKLLDIIPPMTDFSITPADPDGLNGWYVNPPTVNFTVNEESVTYYRWDTPVSAPLVFSEPVVAPEGINKLYYYSVDKSNNVEEEDYLVIKLDTSVPDTDMIITPDEPDGESGWYVTIPEVTLTNEPLATVYYHWDSYPFKVYDSSFNGLVGKHTLYYYSRDEAGHVEPTKSIKINIDLDTPRTTVKLDPVIADGDHNWYTSRPEVSLSVKETNQYDTYYYWDDETDDVQEYSAPFTADLEGAHTLHYYTVDEAGNVEDEKWLDIKIDTVMPETTVNMIPDSPTGETNWYKSESPEITLVTSEPDTKIYYYWDSESSRTIYTDTIVAPEGEHYLYFYSVDIAGNREHVTRVSFKVDTETPEVSCEVHSESGENELGWYLEMPQIELDMDDEGVIYYYMLKDGEELDDLSDEQLETMKQTYVTIYPIEGEYTYYFFAVDKAGNTGDIDDLVICMDLLDPVADIKTDKTVLREGGWVIFDARFSSDENEVESYRFHVGDDYISDWQDEPELNYTFDEPGVYDVCVEVRDHSGRISEESEAVTITVKKKPTDMGTEIAEMMSSTPMILALVVIVVVIIVALMLFVRSRKKKSDYYDDEDYDDDEDDDPGLGKRYAEFEEVPRRRSMKGKSHRKFGTPPPPPKKLPPPPPPPSVVRIVSNGGAFEPDEDSIDWDEDDDEEGSEDVDWDSENGSMKLECPRCEEYFSVPKGDMENGSRIKCPHCGAKGSL